MHDRAWSRIAFVASVAFAVPASACAHAPAVDAPVSTIIEGRERALLAAYASDDADAVIRLCEGDRIVVSS